MSRLPLRTAIACTIAATVVVLFTAASAGAATNLIANGGFEGTGGKGSLGGWAGSGGTLSLVTGNGGGHAAKVTATAASATQMYAYTKTKPVKAAAAGAVYSLTGQVQSALTGQSVCLILKETVGTTTKTAGSAQSCITATTAWQAFPPVSYTVKAGGDSLTVDVQEKPRPAGGSFTIDNIVLTAGSPDAQKPTVPGNVAASANGVNSATVTWSPSSDDSGAIAGYHVYRDGSVVGTAAGTATSFTDGGLSPATTYVYSVDAFDGAGNTSDQSPGSSATTAAAPPSPCGLLPSTGPHVYDHVVVIMEENLNYRSWRNSAQAPYSNLLASQCANATAFSALTHPSQQNYVGTLTGTVPPAETNIDDDNLLHQLGAAGKSWAQLEESMTTNCQHTASTLYPTGHNPAVYLNDLGPTGDNTCATSDIPFSVAGFSPSMLKSFTWITPNLCDDMHWKAACPFVKADAVAQGDAWLQTLLPNIFASADYQAGNTLVLITWDEGAEGTGKGTDCLAVADYEAAGCHIGLVAMSAYITPGSSDSRRLNLYSVLASLENMWGLAPLGNAATAPLLGSSFGF